MSKRQPALSLLSNDDSLLPGFKRRRLADERCLELFSNLLKRDAADLHAKAPEKKKQRLSREEGALPSRVLETQAEDTSLFRKGARATITASGIAGVACIMLEGFSSIGKEEIKGRQLSLPRLGKNCRCVRSVKRAYSSSLALDHAYLLAELPSAWQAVLVLPDQLMVEVAQLAIDSRGCVYLFGPAGCLLATLPASSGLAAGLEMWLLGVRSLPNQTDSSILGAMRWTEYHP
jgi:hypothetical protein